MNKTLLPVLSLLLIVGIASIIVITANPNSTERVITSTEIGGAAPIDDTTNLYPPCTEFTDWESPCEAGGIVVAPGITPAVSYVDGKFILGIRPLARCVQDAPAEWLLVFPKTEQEEKENTDVVFTKNGDEITMNFRHLHGSGSKAVWDVVSEYVVKQDGTFVRKRALNGHAFPGMSEDDFIVFANRALQMTSCR